MANKNTRLVYTDEINLNIYRSLPAEDFKEFMMAYLTYQKGDNIDSMFTSLLSKTLFMTYISKIEYNEDKWEKRAKANQENGKKGGRPKKNDIEPNTEFETPIEKPSTINPLNDVEDDNDFRYGEIDTTNPMVSFLKEDNDEPQVNIDVELKNTIYNLLKNTGNMKDIKQEYIDDMVSMIKDVTKDGVIDWSLVNMWVTKLSFKYNKGKTEIDRFFKLIMDNQVA